MSIKIIMYTNQELRDKYEKHMEYCIELAKRSIPDMSNGRPEYYVKRPYAGAVVLNRSGKVIGEGYKTLLGGTTSLLHAERNALDSCTVNGNADTLVTTLQPCLTRSCGQILDSCSSLIIKKGIKRVVFGARDYSHSMSEDAMLYLIHHRIEVIEFTDLNHRIERELVKSNRD